MPQFDWHIENDLDQNSISANIIRNQNFQPASQPETASAAPTAAAASATETGPSNEPKLRRMANSVIKTVGNGGRRMYNLARGDASEREPLLNQTRKQKLEKLKKDIAEKFRR